MKKTIIVMAMLALACTGHCQKKNTSKTKAKAQTEVRNVIFVVGDGMGTTQVYSSVAHQGERSQFLRFKHSGFSRTYSANKYTTDSGAGGTALMTGHKVENYHIAVGPDGSWHKSFVQEAHEKGMKTGFVVTCHIIDATPASTYGHTTDRNLKDSLSMQLAQCGFDVMVGGQRSVFRPENRKDGQAPIDTLQSKGYAMAYSLEEMEQANGKKLCALLTEEKPGPAPERNDMLTRGTKKALEMLSDGKEGFVLMIEGSQIDWACHDNDTCRMRTEMEDFEKMLKVVLDYAEKDGHTLVVVTADHETGGLALTDGNIDKGENQMKFITGSHTGVMVPVFAFGPKAELFSGIHQNTDFADIIRNLLGLK